jgi:drug/metabolite transporter (DMT)-like permease
VGNSYQRGFVHSRVMDLVFLFVLILLGIGVWNGLSTIVSGDFALAFFLVWLMAAALGWWWTREQPLVLRIPAGTLVFIGGALLLVPLSWWTQSKIVVTAEAAVLAVSARYLGTLWARYIAQKLEAAKPWYLDQSINLIDDLARWIGFSVLAWFLAVVPPMLLVMFMPAEWVPWGALVWSFAATTFYLYKYRKGSPRFLKVPLGLYVFVATAVLLLIFQKQLAGPMQAGSFQQIGYLAYWPAVSVLFMELILIGTRKASP